MPGINAIAIFKNGRHATIDIANLAKQIAYDESYKHDVLFEDDGLNIIFSGYEEYPRSKSEIGENVFIIDGAIYNRKLDEVFKKLGELLTPIVAGVKPDSKKLADFVLSTDGEYTIYMVNRKSSTMIMLNDGLGRLPYYHYADDKRFIVGRAYKFIVNNIPQIQPDKNGLLEYFLFSVPLGERTFFKGISRLMPASLLVVNYKTGQYQNHSLYSYNLDERHEDKPPEYYVQNMHDLFLEGVRNRAEYFKDRKTILAMSGGLDSRAVLMALIKCGVDVQGITFRDYYNALARDLPVVKTIVEKYHVKHRLLNLPENDFKHMEKLIIGKDGMALMGLMGTVLNSMEMIEKEYGKNIVYYTGDEGNYIAAPRVGGKPIKSTPQLLDEIMKRNSLSVFAIEEVAGIFGMTAQEIRDYLCGYFESYPESENIHKVDRFFIFERSFKFTMENQDRIRLFYWPLAPHYSIEYARFAFKIKNKYLAGWKIYVGLLKALDPGSVKIKYANFGLSLDSPLLPIYLPMRALATRNETIRRNLITTLRLIRRPSFIGKKVTEQKGVAELKDLVRETMVTDNSLRDIFDIGHLGNLVDKEKFMYRMYLINNIVKYLSSVKNKQP